jgi:hypothetical protein
MSIQALSKISNGLRVGRSLAMGTVSSTAVSLATISPAIPIVGDWGELQLQTGQIRLSRSGTTPTTTVGMLLTAGDPPLHLDANEMAGLRMIRVSADSIFCLEQFQSVNAY